MEQSTAKPNVKEWIDKIKEVYEKNGKGDVFQGESFYLPMILEKLFPKLTERYVLETPFSVGGSGIACMLKEKNSDLTRVLKFSRPLDSEKTVAEGIKEEGTKLKKLRHPHIIEVYEADILDYFSGKIVGYTVTELMEGGDWESKIKNDLKIIQNPQKVLEGLLDVLYDVTKGLDFLHSNDYVHMDIKPTNVFLKNDGSAKIADLGFTKHLTESPEKSTMIGFSRPFAHPAVLLKNKINVPSENRGSATLQYKQLKKYWDIYSLGRSVLHLLSFIDVKYPREAKHLRIFRYIHLMACRMLDGKNTALNTLPDEFASEFASDLTCQAFDEIKYTSCKEILKDIEKEIGIFTLDKSIPELNIYSRETIRGGEWKPTILTHRVRDLLYHPLLARLAKVSQLGLIRFLYPSASHSRLDHALGTFSNTCAYIDALYHDDNPIFRLLMSKENLESAMLTALLHDLGQYPLAHDLEDVSPKFDHLQFTRKLLKNPLVDEKGRTLEQVVISPELWNNSISRIEDILRSTLHKEYSSTLDLPSAQARILSQIISGPIDADKTDYLPRDGNECHLPYGDAIDFDRLMEVITINYAVKIDDGGKRKESYELAVYHKGRACAESIALTRYLMFSSCYWHHTSRTYKSMVQYAAKLLIESLIDPISEKNFWKDFDEFILGLSYESKKMRSLLINNGPSRHLADSDAAMLNFLYDRAPPPAQELLESLYSRKLYKRLASLDFSKIREVGATQDPWQKLQRESTDWDKKLDLSKKLQKRLLIEVRKASKDSTSVSLNEQILTEFDKFMSDKHLSILIDIPPEKSLDLPLKYVNETMEDRYLDIPVDAIPRLSEAWIGPISDLFKTISTIRIFCHPEVREPIRALFNPDQIFALLLEELQNL